MRRVAFRLKFVGIRILKGEERVDCSAEDSYNEGNQNTQHDLD